VTLAGHARSILRVIEHHAFVYRRTWRGSAFSMFLNPILYLAALGIGLGAFVDQSNPAGVAGVSYATFLAPGILVAGGATDVAHAILMLPVTTLTALAFAGPIQAFSASQTDDAPFATLFRFVIMPMFIFSGTFFPISQLPELLQYVAVLTPLWHAVSLSRGIALEMLDPAMAVINVAYLSAFVFAGLAWSFRSFSRRLAE
jgi:ABC-type polysaccharide/polyol phosphate export permease